MEKVKNILIGIGIGIGSSIIAILFFLRKFLFRNERKLETKANHLKEKVKKQEKILDEKKSKKAREEIEKKIEKKKEDLHEKDISELTNRFNAVFNNQSDNIQRRKKH